jgi:hypothetical protein
MFKNKNNLAIYTLAGSILVSSLIVSMNQVNAHSTSATKREFLALKKCINDFRNESVEFSEYQDRWVKSWLGKSFGDDDEFPKKDRRYEPYMGDSDNTTSYVIGLLDWIADGLEC